jgi:hypothetical protein
MPSSWVSDTIPSLPNPPNRLVQIELGDGFVFTTGGLAHAVTKAEIDDLISGLYGPVDSSVARPPDA